MNMISYHHNLALVLGPLYPTLTFLTYGDTDSPLVQMKEGMDIHMDCLAKVPGSYSNAILTLYNGTNPVSCYIPDNTEGKICVIYFIGLIYKMFCISFDISVNNIPVFIPS